MRVEWNEDDSYTDEEMALLQRAQRALYHVGVPCRGKNSRNYFFMYDISAVIQPKTRTSPLQVNFKATNRNVSGMCMIGPEKDLDEKLFKGSDDEITQAFHREIITAANEFVEAMSRA